MNGTEFTKETTTIKLTPDARRMLDWLVNDRRKTTGAGNNSNEIETMIRTSYQVKRAIKLP